MKRLLRSAPHHVLLFTLFFLPSAWADSRDVVTVKPRSLITVRLANGRAQKCAPIKGAYKAGRLLGLTKFELAYAAVRKLKTGLAAAKRNRNSKQIAALKKKLATAEQGLATKDAACAAGAPNQPIPTPSPVPPSPHLGEAVSMSPLARSLTRGDVQLLLERAGFGLSARDETLVALGMANGIDALVDTFMSTQTESTDLMPRVEDRRDGVMGSVTTQTPLGQRAALLDLWTHTKNPYAEKFGLFLLSIWTVGGEVIEDETFRFVFWDYFNRLRGAAYGDTDLPTLAQAITRDPLMLIYLSNELNVKGSPNENYARELLELFTMGPENLDGIANYTETGDIVNAAKMLTGWQVKPNYATTQLTVSFKSSLHEPGTFTMFSGTAWQFTGANDADLVSGIFQRHPAVKNYYAKEILKEYLTPTPSRELIENFGLVIQANNYKLRPAMATLLKSEAFYSTLYKDTLPKNSLEFMVETIRLLGLEDNFNTWEAGNRSINLGMPVNLPPSVFWFNPQGWTSPSVILERANFVGYLLSDTTSQSQTSPAWTPAKILPSGAATMSQVIDHAAATLGIDPVSTDVKLVLQNYMSKSLQYNGVYSPMTYNNTNATHQRMKGMGVYYELIGSPLFQLK